eukprot:gene42003-53930_t
MAGDAPGDWTVPCHHVAPAKRRRADDADDAAPCPQQADGAGTGVAPCVAVPPPARPLPRPPRGDDVGAVGGPALVGSDGGRGARPHE